MTTYELTSKKIPGKLYLSYLNGFLNTFENAFNEQLTREQFTLLIGKLPYEEQHVSDLAKIGFDVKKSLRDNEKIALFCNLHFEYEKRKYKTTAADSGKIKHVRVTEDLLRHYFKSSNFLFKGKQSIGNLVKYYNELLRDYANQGRAGNDFPNTWDRAFAETLDTAGYQRYCAHLRSLGLKARTDRMGNVLDWGK